jgi:hypothetical protein
MNGPKITDDRVKVISGEATPGEAVTIDAEGETAKQFPPDALLGIIEGTITLQVGNLPARPLQNQLVQLFNKAALGETYRVYTDNQGRYNRLVREGHYIVQICRPTRDIFAYQRLAHVQVRRKTVANINVPCTDSWSENLWSGKTGATS